MTDPDASPITVSDRSRLRRYPKRGSHERATVEAILDAALICHVGFVANGSAVVIPTTHCRVGPSLYLHGARSNRMLDVLAAGANACVTATIVDGIVLARAAAHHSMNFRSVVVFGVAREVVDLTEKQASLAQLIEHVAPGRSAFARAPNDRELHGVRVIAMPIDEASAKIRTGPPVDDADDAAWPHWSGVVPIGLVAGAPVASEGCAHPFVDETLPERVTR